MRRKHSVMSQLMDQVASWIEEIILALGYPGITLVMLIENLFPPIPSELVMPFAGFLVADGKLDFAGIVAAGTLGSVLGALVLYYIGLWGGEAVLRPFVRRFGRWFMTSEDDLDRAIGTFARYGEVMVFVGRLVPIIRSLISLPAGMQRMALPKFLLFTTIGSALWTTLLSYAGLVLGQNWEQVLGIIESYQRVVAVILVIAVLGFVAWKLRQRRAARSA
jgi:membrane protein DedA with SNARE-associated domain